MDRYGQYIVCFKPSYTNTYFNGTVNPKNETYVIIYLTCMGFFILFSIEDNVFLWMMASTQLTAPTDFHCICFSFYGSQ